MNHRMRERINNLLRKDGVSGPALMLVAGRTVGFIAAFAIPVVLARKFDRAAFGTYKQLFLVYATLYGLAQVGAAESLYYFVPRNRDQAGRRVANAIVTLALMGVACFGLLYFARTAIAAWLSNAALADYLPLLGVFLAFTLVSAALEIVMVSRKDHRIATVMYAGSDLLRTALLVLPALAFGSLRGCRRDRRRAGELPPVGGRDTVRRGDIRDLRRRMPADSAGRSGLHLDRQRDDGEDGGVRGGQSAPRLDAVARDHRETCAADVSAGHRAAADGS
jgi:hypothetical protein